MVKKIVKSIASRFGFEIHRRGRHTPTTQPTARPLPPPTRRRVDGNRLRPLAPTYFAEQDRALAEIAPEAWRLGADGFSLDPLYSMLEGERFSGLAERVVEYPWVLWHLARLGGGQGKHLVDVGCVLNHACVSDYVRRAVDMVWFMNPAVERLAYTDRVAYVVGDVRNHRLPSDLKFDLVTCLSTIEHVGMDTKRYGGPGGEVNIDVERPEKNAFPLMGRLFDLLRPGGLMLLSVPFGPFEYVYDDGAELPAFYIFDADRLDALLEAIPDGHRVERQLIAKVVPGVGWMETSRDDTSILPYAKDCAAAGGVALVEIQKLPSD
jgi:SAM-dependent methyltransferase